MRRSSTGKRPRDATLHTVDYKLAIADVHRGYAGGLQGFDQGLEFASGHGGKPASAGPAGNLVERLPIRLQRSNSPGHDSRRLVASANTRRVAEDEALGCAIDAALADGEFSGAGVDEAGGDAQRGQWH